MFGQTIRRLQHHPSSAEWLSFLSSKCTCTKTRFAQRKLMRSLFYLFYFWGNEGEENHTKREPQQSSWDVAQKGSGHASQSPKCILRADARGNCLECPTMKGAKGTGWEFEPSNTSKRLSWQVANACFLTLRKHTYIYNKMYRSITDYTNLWIILHRKQKNETKCI